MNSLREIARELLGLFVDDGSLAIALLGTVFVIGVLARSFPEASAILGAALVLACAVILTENVLRSGRERRP